MKRNVSSIEMNAFLVFGRVGKKVCILMSLELCGLWEMKIFTGIVMDCSQVRVYTAVLWISEVKKIQKYRIEVYSVYSKYLLLLETAMDFVGQ